MAKQILNVEEVKKRSDAAHAYSLEIGNLFTRPPPNELQQYLVPLHRINAYELLWQRETGTYITTGGKETLIHSIEPSLPTTESKTQDIRDEELCDILFYCCQLPRHSWRHVNCTLTLVTQNCQSISLPDLRESESISTSRSD